MKILLVYPEYPEETFWGFKYALKFIGKKASIPPLGLITVASILPTNWNQKLVDMNIEKLCDKDIEWADYVLISAMSVQIKSVCEVIKRCKRLGVKIIAGGPLFTASPEEFPDIDHLILGEAEITFPRFLEDRSNGTARHLYVPAENERADVKKSPLPRFELLKKRKYASMNVQYSRGCPWSCDFCDISALFGRGTRPKAVSQFINELEKIYSLGWRGSVFFSDDNIIGNKAILKNKLLPELIKWTEEKKHPFAFFTEASIDLADDEELVKMMVRVGFNTVFIGIESPNEKSLEECNKIQNRKRDLVADIRKIQKAGLEVQAGFIVGFDSDQLSIFDELISFIQNSRIVTAMPGLLNALKGTELHRRLKNEGRLISSSSGSNTDLSINFIPKMNRETLIEGYRKVVNTIYAPKNFYARLKSFLQEYNPNQPKKFHFKPSRIKAGIKSLYRLGIIGKERFYYWKIFFWSLFKKPKLFPLAITLSIYGHHFRRVFDKQK